MSNRKSGQQLAPRDIPVPAIWGQHALDAILDVIVFSRDNACRLDALLRSMREYLGFPHRLNVVYTTSSLEFESGYDLLRLWNPGINWVLDAGQFKQTTDKLVVSIAQGPGRYLLFLSDNMIFTRSFSAAELMESLDTDKDILAVSLSLGENITRSPDNDANAAPPEFSQGNRWPWSTANPGCWHQPATLDGYIFRSSDFEKLLPRLRYQNPRSLKAILSKQPLARPNLVCEHQSSVIRVSSSQCVTTGGNKLKSNFEALHDAFMRGQAIDAANFTGKVYASCQSSDAIPLIDDERSRQRPSLETIYKDKKAYYRLDLRTIPTFVINCAEDVKFRVFQQEQLTDLGLQYEFVTGLRVNPGWVGVALGHLKALRLSRAKAPFLVLEDDCTFKDNFDPVLEIPVEAQAYYLGVSTFGIPKPGVIAWGKNNTTQWQRYDAGNLRVFNMLARHAVLYLDDEFCKAVIESQVEALTNRNFPHPGDIGLASLHASNVVLTPERSVCQQSNRDVTHVDLPTHLPGNELPSSRAVGKPDRPCSDNDKPPARNRRTAHLNGRCLISHKYRFICFLIPKNACSTLKAEFLKPRYECKHIRSSDLDDEVFENYFKFTFLRDPVSRATSAYQEVSWRDEMSCSTIKNKPFMQIEDDMNRFIAFLDSVTQKFWDNHVRPQYTFSVGIRMDFYGRVETLQSNLESLFESLGMGPCPAFPRCRSREGRRTVYNYDRFNIKEDGLSQELIDRISDIYRTDIDLVRACCPEPQLRLLFTRQSKSSQSRALELSSRDNLTPIELYSRVNQSHTDCLVYGLGSRGFYAEISTVARAMLYAWCNNLQLVLSTREFVWGGESGWADYFEPFCMMEDDVDPGRVKHRVRYSLRRNDKLFPKIRGFQPQEFDFGQTRLTGFQQILAFFVNMIFRPVKDCQETIDDLRDSLDLPEKYDAIHIRRGDKVGDEDVFYPGATYLNHLEPWTPGRTLFVMSDSNQAVVEIRDLLKKRGCPARVVSLVEASREGFDVWKLRKGEKFMGDEEAQDSASDRNYIIDQTYRLIAETVVAAGAERFVSTWRSNVGRFVWYLHPQPDQCTLLRQADLKAGKPSSRPEEPWARQTRVVPGERLGESHMQTMRARYRRLNDAEENCIVMRLTSRPVFDELKNLAQVMIYARVNHLRVVLDEGEFRSACGLKWCEIFEPLLPIAPGVDLESITERVSFDDGPSLAAIEGCRPEEISLGATDLSGFDDIRGFFLHLLFQLVPAYQVRVDKFLERLPAEDSFDALLVRRTAADEYWVPVTNCLKVLGPIPAGRMLVLITDEPPTVRMLHNYLESNNPGARLLALVPTEDARADETKLLFDAVRISVATKARYFVFGQTDTVGELAWLMHHERDWCHLLAPRHAEQYRATVTTSVPAKFRLEVRLRDGRMHCLELPPRSPLIRELKAASLVSDKFVENEQASLIQLPLDDGQAALAFSSHELKDLRLIPRARSPYKPIHQIMNVYENHLGGYVSALHPLSNSSRAEHGDPATWTPDLWTWLVDELGVQSVLDIGCGEGHSTAFFQDLGCRVLGVDGSVLAERNTVVPGFHLRHDFTQGPCIPGESFDMVWCCEFVERIEERFTQNFLASFASATRYICMTFAPPGTSGWHHVNCKPGRYWIQKIERLGYRYDRQLSRKARRKAHGHFGQRGLIFVRDDVGHQAGGETGSSAPTAEFQREPTQALPVNDMEVAKINGAPFYLFLDIFIHPSLNKIVAVLPCYNDDWNASEHGIDFENVELVAGQLTVKGQYLSHRLDSFEPCAVLDFEHEELTDLLERKATISFTIRTGPHRKAFELSTTPEPAHGMLMSLVVKNENRWIRHFIDYYLGCLGVDHILVYDNGTDDQVALLEILQPYRQAGTITYIPWAYRWRNMNAPRKMIAQPQQEAHSLNRFANSRWIGFLDVDEFLRLPGKSLPEFLAGFEGADVDGLSFGLRWFYYEGVLEFDEVIHPPLTFLHAGRDKLGRKRQKLIVSPRRMRFLRLHTLEEGGRELQVDDSDIYFHHYCLRNYRFKRPVGQDSERDDYMLQFQAQLNQDRPGESQPARPRDRVEWVKHINRAIANAETGYSRLDGDALEVNGKCGFMTRHFYNNLCNFKGCRYLEIGSRQGASVVAATFGNGIDAVCIDNFSQFRGSREKFEATVKHFPGESQIQLIEQDCFEVDVNDLGEFDVYAYHGRHTLEGHYKAISHFRHVLAPYSVVIIDDWNLARVRKAAAKVLSDTGLNVLYKKEILLPEEDLVGMPRHRGRESWWNGTCILLLGSGQDHP